MKHSMVWLMAILALVLSIYASTRNPRQSDESQIQAGRASAFDRVQRTGELRVAYLIEPPYLSKETSTGRLSGVFYDVTEQLGENLGLKVIWVEEASLSTLSLGFDNGRYDMIAFPLWRSAARARAVAFSTPMFYTAVSAYVREGDIRFDTDLSIINSSSISVASIDGELASSIAASDYPAARIVSLPNLSDYSQMLLEVATGKADVTFFSRVQANRFMRQNPGKIREVPRPSPIRVFAECFVLPLGDARLESMIDSAIHELIENGMIEESFVRSGELLSDYAFPATPYRLVTTKYDGK